METWRDRLMAWIEERKQLLLIVAAVVVTLAIGTLIGFIVGGGFGDDGSAATTLPGSTSTVASQTTLPPSTTAPDTTVADTEPPIGDFVIILASQDTYVTSDEPAVPQGVEDKLTVEDDPPELQRALIRFDVVGIPPGETVTQAILQLQVVEDSDAPVTVHRVGGPWDETTTWATAPAIGDMVAILPGGSPEGFLVEIDLTGVVTGDGQYDFYLVTADSDTAEYASREAPLGGPALIVGWGDEDLLGITASGPLASEPGSTTTTTIGPPAPAVELTGDSVMVVGAGDIADCDEGAAITAALLDQVFAGGTEGLVFTTGDNAYGDGSAEEFAECYHPTWGRYRDRTRPTPGNHDYNTDDAVPYYEYFGAAAGNLGQGFYSYEAGPWHVVALNSNCHDIDGCDPGDPQYEWLRQDLAASTAACTLAYWHHPVFSSGDHGSDDAMVPILQLLYEGGAEIVLNGHDHDYERFAPQTPGGDLDVATGIREFVVGTGGRNLRDFGSTAANSEVRFSDGYGILRLDLFENGYEWEFLAEPGAGFTDSGAGACH